MAQHEYSLIVGNIGQTWSGTNGAQALREYGQAKASAASPGGRDGWEPVTLFRLGPIGKHSHDGRIYRCLPWADKTELDFMVSSE